jgi:hypothetical protein
MTCSSCGIVFAQDAHFCPRCGTPVAQQPQPAPVYPAVLPCNRVSRHLQIAGILWIVYAFERTASKLVGLMFLHGIFGRQLNSDWGQWSPLGNFGFGLIWPLVAVSLVVGLVLSLLTGYALLTRQPWGRVIAIVTSVLALFHPIFGTALGIYTLWVLAPAASGVEYAALSTTARSS